MYGRLVRCNQFIVKVSVCRLSVTQCVYVAVHFICYQNSHNVVIILVICITQQVTLLPSYIQALVWLV